MDVRVQIYGLLGSGGWLCLSVTRTAMSLLPETRLDVDSGHCEQKAPRLPQAWIVMKSSSRASRNSIRRQSPGITV